MPERLMCDKSDKRVNLYRVPNKLCAKTTWHVVDKEGKYSYGFIDNVWDQHLYKRVGRLEYKRTYWMYHRHHEPGVGVARTRKEVLDMMLSNSGVKL